MQILTAYTFANVVTAYDTIIVHRLERDLEHNELIVIACNRTVFFPNYRDYHAFNT